ncbi:MAG: DUF5131 family protein [Fusobacteriaceae bacterium]
MSNKTKIEWTEVTWNPVTGCTKSSAGCQNCYAEKMAKRLKAMRNKRYFNGFDVTIHEDLLERPLQWKKNKVVFVNSMSDIFHDDVPEEFIKRIFDTMTKADWHIFQVLTKKTDRMVKVLKKIKIPDNVWLGVTVENKECKSRIKQLDKIICKTKFLSCEPLLEDLEELDLSNINWVIVGGESGPKAREVKQEWVENIQAECKKYKSAFFFKQWGGVNKKKNGNLLNGKKYLEFPNTKK